MHPHPDGDINKVPLKSPAFIPSTFLTNMCCAPCRWADHAFAGGMRPSKAWLFVRKGTPPSALWAADTWPESRALSALLCLLSPAMSGNGPADTCVGLPAPSPGQAASGDVASSKPFSKSAAAANGEGSIAEGDEEALLDASLTMDSCGWKRTAGRSRVGPVPGHASGTELALSARDRADTPFGGFLAGNSLDDSASSLTFVGAWTSVSGPAGAAPAFP